MPNGKPDMTGAQPYSYNNQGNGHRSGGVSCSLLCGRCLLLVGGAGREQGAAEPCFFFPPNNTRLTQTNQPTNGPTVRQLQGDRGELPLRQRERQVSAAIFGLDGFRGADSERANSLLQSKGWQAALTN